MSKTAFEQLLDVLTTGREHERTALSAQPVDENHPIFERACKQIKALNNALGELENEQFEAMEFEDRYHEAQDARHDSEVRSQALTEALAALLSDYEELRRAYSDERERDGWDAFEEDDSAAKSRTLLAQIKTQDEGATPLARGAVIYKVIPHGFEAYHTGGGCMAWQKELGDHTHLLLTYESEQIDGDPENPNWLVGRYRNDGDGWICTDQGVTLDQALMVAKAIRAPQKDEQESVSAATLLASAE